MFFLINDNYLLLKLAICSVIKDSNSMAHPSQEFHSIQGKCLLGTSSGRKRHSVRWGWGASWEARGLHVIGIEQETRSGGDWSHLTPVQSLGSRQSPPGPPRREHLSNYVHLLQITFSMRGTALSTAEGMEWGGGRDRVTRPLMTTQGEKNQRQAAQLHSGVWSVSSTQRRDWSRPPQQVTLG